MTDETVHLNELEAQGVAVELVARFLESQPEDIFSWEDLPLLSEHSVGLIGVALSDLAERVRHDIPFTVNAAAIIERAS